MTAQAQYRPIHPVWRFFSNIRGGATFRSRYAKRQESVKTSGCSKIEVAEIFPLPHSTPISISSLKELQIHENEEQRHHRTEESGLDKLISQELIQDTKECIRTSRTLQLLRERFEEENVETHRYYTELLALEANLLGVDSESEKYKVLQRKHARAKERAIFRKHQIDSLRRDLRYSQECLENNARKLLQRCGYLDSDEIVSEADAAFYAHDPWQLEVVEQDEVEEKDPLADAEPREEMQNPIISLENQEKQRAIEALQEAEEYRDQVEDVVENADNMYEAELRYYEDQWAAGNFEQTRTYIDHFHFKRKWDAVGELRSAERDLEDAKDQAWRLNAIPWYAESQTSRFPDHPEDGYGMEDEAARAMATMTPAMLSKIDGWLDLHADDVGSDDTWQAEAEVNDLESMKFDEGATAIADEPHRRNWISKWNRLREQQWQEAVQAWPELASGLIKDDLAEDSLWRLMAAVARRHSTF